MNLMIESLELQTVLPVASTWWETEYCLDVCYTINAIYNEIYWVHKKLC